MAAAIQVSAASVAWALVAGTGSLVAGITADSAALIGFGLSSIVDGTASAVLIWRFRHERLGTRAIHEVEHRAAISIGAILVAVALFVATRAVLALVHHSEPDPTAAGIAFAGASVLVLPVLSRVKLRLSKPLNSRALRADGVLSGAGAALAAAVLISIGLESLFDVWWADSIVALGIAAVLLREGVDSAGWRA